MSASINTVQGHFRSTFNFRDGMVKISETCEKFGGDLQTIQSQLDANAKAIDKVNLLLHQYRVRIFLFITTPAFFISSFTLQNYHRSIICKFMLFIYFSAIFICFYVLLLVIIDSFKSVPSNFVIPCVSWNLVSSCNQGPSLSLRFGNKL